MKMGNLWIDNDTKCLKIFHSLKIDYVGQDVNCIIYIFAYVKDFTFKLVDNAVIYAMPLVIIYLQHKWWILYL